MDLVRYRPPGQQRSLPEAQRRRRAPGDPEDSGQRPKPEPDANQALRDAFSSPARLAATLRDRVIEPQSLFYCPGSLLQNDFDTKHPVGAGLPPSWPVFFESDQAYRLTPSFDIRAEVVSRYPLRGPILRSGWLLGEDLLRDQANVVAFRVGKGYVVTLGTQVAFRAQARATYKLVFNALFYTAPQRRLLHANWPNFRPRRSLHRPRPALPPPGCPRGSPTIGSVESIPHTEAAAILNGGNDGGFCKQFTGSGQNSNRTNSCSTRGERTDVTAP
jgi:hypothetical protein